LCSVFKLVEALTSMVTTRGEPTEKSENLWFLVFG